MSHLAWEHRGIQEELESLAGEMDVMEYRAKPAASATQFLISRSWLDGRDHSWWVRVLHE